MFRYLLLYLTYTDQDFFEAPPDDPDVFDRIASLYVGAGSCDAIGPLEDDW